MTTKSLHVVHIISRVDKSIAFEWFAMALNKKYTVTFVLLNPGGSALERFLTGNGITVKRLSLFGKTDYPRVLISLWFFLLRKHPDIIHAHLLDAQLLGLTAGFLAGVRKRIYTRHTSNYHHVYFPSGVRLDRWSNLVATHILSISQATDHTLIQLEGVDPRKIRKIHHGFQFSDFERLYVTNIDSLKSRWAISERYPVIGVIARHIEWKGIQYIIPAFAKLLNTYPSALLVLANSNGPYHQQLKQLLKKLPGRSYVMIPFEEDVVSLYATFDLYVHVPIDKICEAFGQTYVEALAAEVPSVFTKSGIAAEFIEHKENAWVVDYKNSDDIYRGMVTVLQDPELQRKMRRRGKKAVQELFDIKTMVKKLQDLYDE